MSEVPLIPLVIDNKPFDDPDAQVALNHSAFHGGSPYTRYVSATPASTKAAVESSLLAFKTWPQTLPSQRRQILQRAASLIRENAVKLIQVQVEETNCTEFWAQRNVAWSATHIEEMAGRITSVLSGELPVLETPGQTGFVYKAPIGPVLSIPPWNAALFLACRTIDTPLAVGCTVLLKASEQCPRTHHMLAGLFHKAGVPEGVLNVIQARREDAAAVTEAAISHPGIRKVEFIGSASVGRVIGSLASKYLKPILMELGGKSPGIVLEDADLELAARSLVEGAFRHHGQICFSTETIIVRREVADAFVECAKKVASQWKTEPAISAAGPRRALGLVQDALSKGAKILLGEPKLLNDYSLTPIILSSVTPEMEIADEESFGPIAILKIVASDEEAVSIANSTSYGLGAGVFSKDVGRAFRIARQIEAGQTHINWPYGTGADEATLGVGLAKSSGFGRQNANHGLEEFLIVKTITITDPVAHFKTLSAMQG